MSERVLMSERVCPDECACPECVSSLFSMVRKQLAFMLGRQQVFLTLDDKECANSEDLSDIMSNVHLNTNFLALGREVRHVAEWGNPHTIIALHHFLYCL